MSTPILAAVIVAGIALAIALEQITAHIWPPTDIAFCCC